MSFWTVLISRRTLSSNVRWTYLFKSQLCHKSSIKCPVSNRYYSLTKSSSIHISELFKNELLKQHTNPEVIKLVRFILNNSKAMIDPNQALTLHLKVNFHQGKPYYLSSSQVPKHVFQSINKNSISTFGPDSESAAIIDAFTDLVQNAKIKNGPKMLQDLYFDMPNNAWPCLMIGLYCSKDLETLRAPSTVFNHLIEELA